MAKTYPGGTTAVRDLSLTISSGSTLCFIGTSGCGKTTTLKMINRLIEPTSGVISIGGTSTMDRDPIELRRSIGYVIQRGGLFPHMSVSNNVAVVAKLVGWDAARTSERVDQLLDLVSLEPDEYRDRLPHELSGGQQQRVGVARALMVDPPIILMDEPFGALDPITRDALQDEFVRLQRELGKTIVFVTHDMSEAVKLADQIAIMDAGVLQQAGSPTDLIEHPANEFVADFMRSHRQRRAPDEMTVADVLVGEVVSVMSPPPSADALIAELDRLEHSVAFVVDADGNLTGRIEKEDLASGDLTPRAVVAQVQSKTPLGDVIDHVFDGSTDMVGVVDEDGRLTGALTRDQVLDSFRDSSVTR